MSREAIPLSVPDVSLFARALARNLAERLAKKPEPPGHVELLNLLARAAGLRNFQSLRAAPPPLPEAVAPAPLSDNARKALGQFDAEGRLLRWPVKFTVQRLVMWTLWTRFDAKRRYTEDQSADDGKKRIEFHPRDIAQMRRNFQPRLTGVSARDCERGKD